MCVCCLAVALRYLSHSPFCRFWPLPAVYLIALPFVIYASTVRTSQAERARRTSSSSPVFCPACVLGLAPEPCPPKSRLLQILLRASKTGRSGVALCVFKPFHHPFSASRSPRSSHANAPSPPPLPPPSVRTHQGGKKVF